MNQKEKEQWQSYLKKNYKNDYVKLEHRTKSTCIAYEGNPILWFALNEEEDIQWIVDTHNANILVGIYE